MLIIMSSVRACVVAIFVLGVVLSIAGCNSRVQPNIRPPPTGSGLTTQLPTQPPSPTGPTTTPSPDVCPGGGRAIVVTTKIVLFSDWPSMSASGPRTFLTDHLPAFSSGNNCLNVRVADLVLTVTGSILRNWVDGDVTRVSRTTNAGGGQDFQSFLQQLQKSGTSVWLNVIPNDSTWSAVCTGQPNVVACLFRFAATWNAFIKAQVIVGIVIDGISISSRDLPTFMSQGASAKGSLKLGLTVGLGLLNGMKNQYGTSVDFYLSFLLDFWVPSPQAYFGSSSEFFTRRGNVQDMTNFLLSSTSGESPLPRTDTQRYDDDTAMLWSPRHFGSTGCMYPLNTGTCTNSNGTDELGSWAPNGAIELMKSVRSRVGSEGTRMGFYTLSLMPFTWLTTDYRRCFGRNC